MYLGGNMRYYPMMTYYPMSSGGGGSYVLPVASSSEMGGVKVRAATAGQTADVGIDENGFLKVAPDTGEVNVQSDWNQTDDTADDFIKNKPTVGDVNVQSDWNQTDTEADDFIKNKPTLPDVSGKRDLPAATTVYVVSQTAEIAVMNANTVYTVDPQATFTIVNIASTSFATSNLESQVWFTTGNSAPTVTVNSGIKIIGSVPTFAANKGYVLSVQNGVGVWGEYSVS